MLTPIAHTGRSFNPPVLKGASLPTGVANPTDTIEMMGASMHFKRNAEIYGETSRRITSTKWLRARCELTRC